MSALRQFKYPCDQRAAERQNPRERAGVPLAYRPDAVNYLYIGVMAAGRQAQGYGKNEIQESDRRHLPKLRQTVESIVVQLS